MADVFLGLGSNEGDREENIRMALRLLERDGDFEIKAVSSLYETKVLGSYSQPDFINCVIRLKTSLSPQSLLKIAKSIELSLGREPDTHMRPRPMDIDILLYDNIDLDSADLRIPHSRLLVRRFVLEPLLEIDCKIVNPVTNEPLKNYLDDVKNQQVIKILDSTEVWNG